MTLNGSMDGNAFEVFYQRMLSPKVMVGAVVVMDIMFPTKIASIEL